MRFALWFDPWRMLRLFALRVALIGVPIALLAAGCAWWAAEAMLGLGSTYTLTATVRLVPVSQPINIAADLQPYAMPEFQPAEVLTWFYRNDVCERGYRASGRNDGAKVFRSLIKVVYSKDAKQFYVTYSGAPSAEAAANTLDSYIGIVIDHARKEAQQRIDRDRLFYQDRLNRAKIELDEAKSALSKLGAETGVVSRDEEIAARMRRAAECEERSATVRAELAYLDRRMSDLPTVIAGVPAEVPGHRSLVLPMHMRMEALRDQERRYAALYTDAHPQLIAVREEIAALDKELAHAADTRRPDGMDRNPVVDALQQELARLTLDRPRLLAEAERLEAERTKARAALAAMPGILSQFDSVAVIRSEADLLCQRLSFRLSEIHIARELNNGQLERVEHPRPELSLEKPLRLKQTIIAAAVACATLGGIAALCAWFLLRDTRLRSAQDALVASNARHAETLPCASAAMLAASVHGNLDPAVRAWLQHIAAQLTSQARSFLVVGSSPQLAAQFARVLAQQFARSGLATILIDQRPGETVDSGLDRVLEGSVHPQQALRDELGACRRLPVGDADTVADQIASGHVEILLKELQDHCQSLVVCLPHRDPVLLTRAAKAVNGIILVLAAQDRNGRALALSMRSFPCPVHVALVAKEEHAAL